MDRSLALVLPDRPGVLREVMWILATHDVSVLRMSYNRVVDIHTLFVDVFGTKRAIEAAEEELRAWRFLPGQRPVGEVRLIEMRMDDELTQLDPVLTIIRRHELNITYLDVQTDSNPSVAQIGLYVMHLQDIDDVLEDIRTVCDANLVAASERPNMLDNNHFNLSFARSLSRLLELTTADEEEILINSNRIMQNLMHDGADPYKPFDQIFKIGEAHAFYRKEAFADACRISRFKTAGGVSCVSIEPPVGSTTWVLECDDVLLCVDAGYCCYAEELAGVLRDVYPDWDDSRRELVITHGDIDHVGACELFDRVYASNRTIEGFSFEAMGIVSWREQNVLSFPYNRIGKILSRYRTPDFASMVQLGESGSLGLQDELLRRIDTLDVAPLSFEVWEGRGGHVRGEIVLIERRHRLCVTGDLFVNVHGETKPQSRFNSLAPYLMTSVDTDATMARQERAAILSMLDPGPWQILGGHGRLYHHEA